MTSKAQNQQIINAVTTLRDMLKPGDVVHTILRQVSRSGMSRHISVIRQDKDGPHDITYLVGRALNYRQNAKDGGLVVGGCGMDMGFEVVYNLGRALFPKGFKVEGRGRNGDTSGWDNDGGYALKHRWL